MKNRQTTDAQPNTALQLHLKTAPSRHRQRFALQGAPEREAIAGRVDFACSDLLEGLQVHVTDGEERVSGSVSTTLLSGLTLVVLLEGTLHFALNGMPRRADACVGPVIFAYSLSEKTRFEKFFQCTQRVRKVAITLPAALLHLAYSRSGALPLSLRRFVDKPLAFWQQAAPAQVAHSAVRLLEQDKNAPPFMHHAHALELLSLALDVLSASHQSEPGAVVPDRGKDNIKSHIDKKIASSDKAFVLSQCAHELNMSVSKLQRLFKAAHGQTVYEYVKLQRLTKAREALLNKKLSIGEAAYLAGYNHSSNFALAFKKAFGISPGMI